MQRLPPEVLSQAKSERMKQLEAGLKELISGTKVGERVECPICHYISPKNKKGSAVIFEDSIKCFACGIWRKII